MPGTIFLLGGDGADSYSINVGVGLPTTVVVTDDGVSGSDDLRVNGTSGDDIIYKTATQVTLGDPVTMTIVYGGLEDLTVDGGEGDDTIVDPGANTTILGGLGNDLILIDATTGNGV